MSYQYDQYGDKRTVFMLLEDQTHFMPVVNNAQLKPIQINKFVFDNQRPVQDPILLSSNQRMHQQQLSMSSQKPLPA